MPANVSPEYEKAEEQYRAATTDEDRLDALQLMLRTLPKHKGTEKMQADIKSRLSRLRRAQQKKGAKKGPDPFHVPKSGAGQVVLAGPANTGKSSLLAATTNADVKVADYPFTTVVPLPGMWTMHHVPIQLVDTPPLSADLVPAGLMGTLRAADVVALMVDASGQALQQADDLLALLSDRRMGLRSVPRPALPSDDPDLRPGLLVATKTDAAPPETVPTLRELLGDRIEVRGISSRSGQGLEDLFHRLWELLAMIRVYSKQPGEKADLSQPFTLPVGSTVGDLARAIHRDLPDHMRSARVWGETHHDGQHVQQTEELGDGDIVEIHE